MPLIGQSHSLMRRWPAALALAGVLMGAPFVNAAPATKPAAVKPAVARRAVSTSPATDFAPGLWTDGVERHLDDYRGKIVILVSFDPTYLDSPGDVKKQLAVYDLFRDKPVVFLGVLTGARDIAATRPLLKNLGLSFPMYFDNIGQMQGRYYGSSAHLRMIDAQGNISFTTITPQDVDHALADVKWKYKDGGYDKRLDGVIDLLEWNHYDAALKQLKSSRHSSNKEVAASAEKLYADVHAEGEKWKSDAADLKDTDPAAALDLYTQITIAFAGEDLARTVAEPLKQLRATKPVQDELAARAMYRKLYDVIPRAKYEQRVDVADFCDSIGKKYPETPTGKKAKALWGELMGQR